MTALGMTPALQALHRMPWFATRRMTRCLLACGLLLSSLAAQADAVATLRGFVQNVASGKAAFTQTVVSPDGAKKKTSSGSFAFARPNRFRFAYEKPTQQLIVADGKTVWLYDADLNQVSSRPVSLALGSTPAALLAGGSLDKDFDLSNLPSADGLDWAEAMPKQKDGAFKLLRVGFRGTTLAAVEILDNFGQTSTLRFTDMAANAAIAPEQFSFTPPPGADVLGR